MAMIPAVSDVLGLADVLITAELSRRPPRTADLLAENRALHALARRMAERPQALLKGLVAVALELCRAGSTGVSLLEPGANGGLFRWVALAGAYERYEGGTTPGRFSPCGTCLERRSPQLYSYPARHYSYLDGAEPPLVEGLVIPLVPADGLPIGTIWIVSHDEGRRFDSEDVRLMTALADFTAAALRLASMASENARLYCEALEEIAARQRAEEALQEADRKKDEFLATLAHELRNPLAPIRNALHLMGHRDRDGHDIEVERAMAERQVLHLARLVDDLMDVARIGRGKIDLRKEVLELAPVVRRAAESVRSSLVERGHALIVELPEGPIRLEADPTRLEQVLDNLLTNAAKYTEPGGRVWLTAERDGGEVVVRVRDTGIGIAPEMLPRIFDLFVQVDHRSDRSQGGLGIGLGLVKSLVAMHGGSITAHSEGPDRGSEFMVRLPILPEASEGCVEPKRDDRRQAEPSPPRRRILVVDDNVDAAISLAKVLTRLYGQEVLVVHNGPSALEMAGEFRPEVVLLDIGLPGMDGYEVAERLRREPESGEALLVALTGWGQEEDRRRSKEVGFDLHLVKPVEPEAIRELLTEHIG